MADALGPTGHQQHTEGTAVTLSRETVDDWFATRHSALAINFILECCTSATPGANIWPGGWESSAGKECREWMKAEGLIDPETEHATERGMRWGIAITDVPLPELKP
jgi:hypothetical protein